MRLLWLADELRAWGLKVVELPGWRDRGEPLPGPPLIVMGHHTGTPLIRPGDMPTARVLVDGRRRPDPRPLAGPLSQLGIGRSGAVYVVASGKANHAGKGLWRGTADSGWTVGIEAEHPGKGLWPAVQLAAFDRTAACLLHKLGLSARSYCGHREWARPEGRKQDPSGIHLPQQRERIAALLATPPSSGATDAPPSSSVAPDSNPQQEATMTPEQERKLDALTTAVGRLQQSLGVIIRGTPAGTHPGNLEAIRRDTDAIREALAVSP